MHCPRLCIVVLQELHCLLNFLRSELEVSITSPSGVTLHLLVAKCIA